jgi:OOP family OmpA-OmpF porin
MKLGLFLAVTLPIVFYAQDSTAAKNNYPNTFSSGSAKVEKFDNSARRFNDWAISVGGGGAFMAKGDLTSFYGKKINWGWNAYASLDKQITHTFGASIQYQMGETNQRGQLPGAEGIKAGIANAYTKYQQVAILGDVNFSNLLRRVDNHSNYRWALHGYGGVGIQAYKTLLIDNDLSVVAPNRLPIQNDQKLNISSLFFQGGLGLKYKVSKLIDLELRTMYILSGDEEFDGGGEVREVPGVFGPRLNYNLINDAYGDDMLTVNLGLSIKLGKHDSHLAWHDPLQEAYYRVNVLENADTEFVVCEKGDNDNDGVCDDWDRQLDTPTGARVDGAGVALDMDLDGTIDLYDKCVTVPGPIENMGCPVNTAGAN